MKKIFYLVFALLFTGCEDFLDTQNYKEKDDSNFPVTEEDAEQMVTGVYSTMATAMRSPASHFYMVSEQASEECFGGGGLNDKQAQANDHLLIYDENPYAGFWSARYTGINRANNAITALNNMEDGEVKNQKLGECYFLRSYFYFELAQMFEAVPLINKAPSNVVEAQTPPEQATPEELYAHIASDLRKACEIMPAKKWNEFSYGTATRWAAEALLARVYLFYTGFYQKDALPTEEGDDITKDYVIAKLQDCIDNSGHQLVSDFRSLWAYSNKSTLKDVRSMPEDKRPKWYSDDIQEWKKDGENPEQIFVFNCHYMDSYPSDGNMTGFANLIAHYSAFRSVSDADYGKDSEVGAFPLGKGWGYAPVATNFYTDNNWEAKDKRRDYSVMYVDPTKYDGDKQMEGSGYWQLKNITISCYNGENRLASFCSSTDYWGDGVKSDYQSSVAQSLTLIRYADVLLMQAELTEDMSYTDDIRRRAGLEPIGYSLEAIQNERAHELAFEGVRWMDIRRWHIAESMLQKQVGTVIYNEGQQVKMNDQKAGYVTRYKETRGFFAIPKTEIDLSNGTMKQNAGWDGDVRFSTWE